ncbi:hypothetical protein XELAEV_18044810mg [Xenopus laevis]|uniref:glucuronosyltransferase n=1 Tax=Xenopus laevis TaxID=8355 RepID=A0A974H451_XENLA|nr:hypothetical protein XELAEV_18044810mg [Xenopus laevis]
MALLIYSAVWFLFCLGALTGTEGGKLLVVPMDGSHWLSMSSVVERLAQNGHEIIVAKPENSIVKFGSQHFTLRNFPTAYSNQDIHELLQQFFGSQFSSSSVIEVALTTYNGILSVQNMMNSMCESLLHNKQFIQKLQEEKFDAVLNDPMFFCGVILAEHLGIPSVNFLRGVPCMYDYISAQCDSPLSYVPRPFAQNSDKMNFLQRLGNTLFWLSEPVFCGAAFRGWERVASEFLQKKVTAIELLSRTSIWLMRYDFVFEHPRPMMPNMVFIGGINCAGRKPLSQQPNKRTMEEKCTTGEQPVGTAAFPKQVTGWSTGSGPTRSIGRPLAAGNKRTIRGSEHRQRHRVASGLVARGAHNGANSLSREAPNASINSLAFGIFATAQIH